MDIPHAGLLTAAALAAAITMPPAATASMPSIPWDFNGDGRADLAVGTPHEDGNRGAVNVIYGSATGLTAAGDDYWTQDSPGIRGARYVANRNMGFGATLASGDFDADGYADLAVASPEYPSAGTHPAGAVNVIYGSAAGLTDLGDQLLTPGSVGADAATTGFFGRVMTTTDLDGDGFADLVLGLPSATVGYVSGPGEIRVVFGSASGLSTTGVLRLDAAGTLPDSPDGWAGYGSCLASGDFNGDQDPDLVTCAHATDGSFHGAVAVVYGSAAWTEPFTSQVLDAGVVPGVVDSIERFSTIPVVGDFDDDAFDDLALGFPGASDPQHEAAGAVMVLPGSGAGLSTAERQLWRQSSPGIPGTPEELDQFGAALAAGDLNGDGSDDLVVGVPHERTGTDTFGMVTVIPGGPSGLTAAGSRNWTLETAGVPGASSSSGVFGSLLFVADVGRSGRDDLVLGLPYTRVSSRSSAGAVDVLYGSATWLTTSGAQRWHQDSAGIKGTAESRDYFAWAAQTP
jgi:hypothetical protein